MWRRTNFGKVTSSSDIKQVGFACAKSCNYDLAPLLVLCCVGLFFAVFLFETKGFFADEFQYIDLSGLGQEGLAARLLTIRPPFVPLVLKFLNPLGLVFGSSLGLLVFKCLVWAAGILGAFLLGKELADGDEKLGWFFVLVLGTCYVWVFYAAKVLTDALVVVEAVWLFLCLQKTINGAKEGGFRLWEAWLAGAFIVLAAGLTTKPTFLAFVPLSALFVLAPRAFSLLAVSGGYLFLALQANVLLTFAGADRYFLPFSVFLHFGAVLFSWKLESRLAWLLTGVIVFGGILTLAVFGPGDLPKFGEMRALSGLNGSVAANMPDYAEFYCPACQVIELKNANLSQVDWVAVQEWDETLVEQMRGLKARLSADGNYSVFYEERGLTIFQRLTAK